MRRTITILCLMVCGAAWGEFTNWYDWELEISTSKRGKSKVTAKQTTLRFDFSRLNEDTNRGFIHHIFRSCEEGGECSDLAPWYGSSFFLFEINAFFSLSQPTFNGEKMLVATVGGSDCLDPKDSLKMNWLFDTWQRTSDITGPRQAAFGTMTVTNAGFTVDKIYQLSRYEVVNKNIPIPFSSCTAGAYAATGNGDRGGTFNLIQNGAVYSTKATPPHRVVAFKQLPISSKKILFGSYSGFNFDSNELQQTSRPIRCRMDGEKFICNPVTDISKGILDTAVTISATVDDIDKPEHGMMKLTLSESPGGLAVSGLCNVYVAQTTAISCISQSTSGNPAKPSTWILRADRHPFGAGGLDTYEFGAGQGRVITDLGSTEESGQGLALQSNGKIVIVGYTTNSSGNRDFATVRQNPDGSLDTSFGSQGRAITQVGPANDVGRAVAVHSDGKIIVAGESNDQGYVAFALIRYQPDGNLDTSFGVQGRVLTSIGPGDDFARALAIQSDGKIVVAGWSRGYPDRFTVVRYHPSGALDESFSLDGKVSTIIRSGMARANSVAIQSDGKIVVAGFSSRGPGKFNFVVVRYYGNGTLDPTFSRGGILTVAFPLFVSAGARALAIQGDGKILVAGFARSGRNLDFAMVRLNVNGTVDSTFGHRGFVTTDLGTRGDEALGIALQTDGNIILAGKTLSGIGLARYKNVGTLDASFDHDGKLTTAGGRSANDLAIQADGKIVVAGDVSGDFVILRVWP